MSFALICFASLALAGTVLFVLVTWLATRKDRRAERLDASMERCAGKPVDMTIRIWQDQSGKMMCENDGRER